MIDQAHAELPTTLSPLLLHRLGQGESIASICASEGISRTQFDSAWQATLAVRTPNLTGTVAAAVQAPTEIVRDAWGIPHIYAENDSDLFVAFGWAMAQDRLWQLDYLRRKAVGRLAEILGPEAVQLDVLARTVGLHRIAAAELQQLPPQTVTLLQAFSDGINAYIRSLTPDQLPIEFALLDYAPEAWQPVDSVAIWGEFRWYLTGRLPVIALPEIARHWLSSETLYQAFLHPESGEESIVPPGSYVPNRSPMTTPVGATIGDPDEGSGSNNWTVAGHRSANGSPLLASDPHIAFGAVSCWYEAHLVGATFNTTGTSYVGVPALLFGRNEKVAWGLTNNICSQRDLYLEKTSPDHPDHFLLEQEWLPARHITETIHVRGGEPVVKTIVHSHNGPLVNHLLPKAASDLGPVSLRWMGATFCDELTPLHNANRARSADEFREALRRWRVPTWNYIFADTDGHIGYQAVGHIPVRAAWQRGFRPGWEAAHQWQEVIPYEGMPAIRDPESGWIRTANNRNAPEDFPYPLSGTWSSGHRAERIRHMLEEKSEFDFNDFRRMHHDVLLQRAVAAVPNLLSTLEKAALTPNVDARIVEATAELRRWHCRMETDSVAASIFELFFRHWSLRVAAQRFDSDLAPSMAGVIGGLALSLLGGDEWGWFVEDGSEATLREQQIVAALVDALDELTTRLGPALSTWQWGKLHTITLRHTLTKRGDLSQLLDRGNYALGGNSFTVCNTGYVVGSDGYEAALGANYRLIADLGHNPPGLWAVDAAGQSGNPGSANYCDQLDQWLTGDYHFLPLDRAAITAQNTQTLSPQ